MALQPERAPPLLLDIRRKLTHALIMIVLIPVLTIATMLLLILIAINPNSWRQVAHPVRDASCR
jgi:phosphotransferase system  glucose/maltose/N-acetylglucosamine-specific IIC component